MAGDLSVAADGTGVRRLASAAGRRSRAPQVEVAAARAGARRRQLPLDRVKGDEPVILEHELRHTVEERARIGS